MKRIKFYLDFDGTITQNDVVDTILERFADKSWQKVEKKWQEGKIGSRECLSRQLKLVKASQEDLKKLCDEVAVDPHFLSFLQAAFKMDCQVTITSDGFGFVIRNILDRYLVGHEDLLKKIPIYSNDIEWTASGPEAVFSSPDLCRHKCANCKPEVIKNTAWPDDTVLFVGDGLSDRYAAHIASMTFAKGKLLKYCQDNEIAYEPFMDFSDVEKWFLKNYEILRSRYAIQPRIV